MRKKLFFCLLVITFSISELAHAQASAGNPPQQGGDFSNNPNATKVPANTILVKGAVPSASDSAIPLPEGGRIAQKVYTNPYFDLSYPLPPGWRQKYVGPPPSDSGYYVLAQIEPGKTFKGPGRGTILISAQDLFFGLTPSRTASELVQFKLARLSADYKVEQRPVKIRIANHTFIRMDYMSPIAELHWYTLATEVRCHEVEFLLTSRNTALLESVVRSMDKMTLPQDAGPDAGKGGGQVPVCIKDYATGDNVTQRVEPAFAVRQFNPIPARIVIDKYGKVKHVHVISAFPQQAKAVIDALLQWEFRHYRVNGKAVEVETGIMFGAAPELPRKARKGSPRVAD